MLTSKVNITEVTTESRPVGPSRKTSNCLVASSHWTHWVTHRAGPTSGRTSMSYCKCQSLYWPAITGMLTRTAGYHVPAASGNSTLVMLPPPTPPACCDPVPATACALQILACLWGCADQGTSPSTPPWAYGCTRPQHCNPFAVVERNKRMATGSKQRVKQHGITQDGAGTDTKLPPVSSK